MKLLLDTNLCLTNDTHLPGVPEDEFQIILEGPQCAILLLRQLVPDLIEAHRLLYDLIVGRVQAAVHWALEEFTLVLASHLVKKAV